MSPLRSIAPSFDRPLELLQACHDRIETQLQTLETLPQILALKGCDAQAREAARTVLRYFDTSGAMHHQDEDQDLFPLLRTLAAEQGRVEIAAVIDELEREHQTMDAQWRRLRERLAAIDEGREARADPEDIARFCWLYRRHMRTEGAAVMPFARQVLDERGRAALGERMAARRKMG